MNRFFRSAFFPLIVIVLLVWLASETLFPKTTKATKVTYSQLQADVRATPNKFEEILFNPNKRAIIATLKAEKESTSRARSPSTTRATSRSFSSRGCSS